MKEYFKNMKDRKFIISIILMLVTQQFTYAFLKLFQSNFHVFDHIIDMKIPFIPQFIIIYNLFYPVVFFFFYNMFNKDKDTYYKGIIAGILGFIIADIIFLIYPTIMIRPDITNLNIDPINKLILYITYKVDTPAINCFPSMHCVFCFQTLYSILRCKGYNHKCLSSILLLLIIASTLFVKQHYFIDVVAALIIVIICNIISEIIYKLYKKKK